jgi:SNF2 family DNA or RNA helicase
MEQLKGKVVRGPFWPEPVRVLEVEEILDGRFRIKAEGIISGRVYVSYHRKEDLEQLEEVPFPSWSGKGDGEKAFLALEAQRIRLAYLFDPILAVTVSQIDPLPHQIEAVYYHILRNPRIRFLLADDPGAGKTIVAGLVLKELKYRGLINRILVVVPGHLKYQWHREMKEKFGEDFTIVDRQVVQSFRERNVWLDFPQVITSMDFAKQEDILASLKEATWDLVIVDEAHKMAAYRYGNKTERTERYKLGEVLSARTHFMLFLTATPHKGDPENFRLLLELLEPGMFPTPETVNQLLRNKDCPIFLRRLKEDLKNYDGSPLFPQRIPHTVCYRLSEAEKYLYNQVTEYVRKHYRKAVEKKRHGVGFAMLILQRRMASSVRALYATLKNRYARLNEALGKWEEFLRRQREVSTREIDEEELEDADEKTRWEEENELVEYLTNAETLEELREELGELERLIRLAERIIESGQETKLMELQKVLELEQVKEKGVKLLVFTESRETMEYLAEKFREWRFSVTTLHGNMSPEERVRAEHEFREETQIMVSTEAGGEGINLQFCWLVVNYDIPWNPNRLDQRIGRVHRYGQRYNVHIYNLVAEDTIEGRILKTLQEKLQRIKEVLGSDRVFDVLGDTIDHLLQGRSLKDLFIEALSNPTTLEDIVERIERVPDEELVNKVKEATMEMLANRHINLSWVIGESERARENRLIPEYIERFFLKACDSLEVTVKPRREKGVFQIEWVPARLRNVSADFKNRYGEVKDTYRSFTFRKELAKDTVEFVAPAHPLLEAIVDAVMAEGREELQKGACFYDPTRRWDGWLWIVEGEIVDGKRTVAGKRLFAVYQPKQGQPTLVNPSVLWDLNPVPPEELEDKFVEPPSGMLQEDTLLCPQDVLRPILDELETYKDELKAERERFASVRERYTIPTLKSLINAQEAKVAELRYRELAGEKVDLLLHSEMKRLDELEGRLQEIKESLKTETALTIGEIKTIGVLRVMPLPETKLDEADGMSEDPTLEAIGLQVAMEYEHREGRSPTDVSLQRLGYDIKSRAPDGSVRYIEVKTRAHTGSVALTEHEWLKAKQLGDSYWLYIVENAVTNPTLWIIQNPAEKLEPKATVVQYIVRDWKNAAQPAVL